MHLSLSVLYVHIYKDMSIFWAYKSKHSSKTGISKINFEKNPKRNNGRFDASISMYRKKKKKKSRSRYKI